MTFRSTMISVKHARFAFSDSQTNLVDPDTTLDLAPFRVLLGDLLGPTFLHALRVGGQLSVRSQTLLML
jgi:hypothetical protein